MLFLLAQTRIEAVTEAYIAQTTEKDSTGTLITLAFVGVALLMSLAIYFYVTIQSKRVIDCPVRLFKELCRAHGLGWRERKVMLDFARSRKMANPIHLMLDYRLWEMDLERDAKFLKREALRKRIKMIQRVLFQDNSIVPESQLADGIAAGK